MTQRLWSDFVSELEPYVPGEQPRIDNLVKLNTNENPYGPSPQVAEAIKAALGDELRLYPPPNADRLKQVIADYHQVAVNQVFVGNGSDEVLAHTFNGLFRHGKPLLFPDITYSFYPVYCGLYEIEGCEIPLTDNFEIAVDDYLVPNGGIIFPNPNAPTGRLLSLDSIASLLRRNSDSVVCVDEAYIDFGGESAISLVDAFDNLLVIQTLSKSRSLAGLRLGFAIGHPTLIEALERIKNSFNSYPVSRLAIAGGVAAFADEDYFQKTCTAVIASRVTLVDAFEKLGFEVIPSAANFVLARHPDYKGEYLMSALRERNIIVRHFGAERIEQFLRITVGTPRQNTLLLAALKDIIV